MLNLIKIIKKNSLNYVESFVKGSTRGVLHGLYSPLLITTGLHRINDNVNNLGNDRLHNLETICDIFGQIYSCAATWLLSATYAISLI